MNQFKIESNEKETLSLTLFLYRIMIDEKIKTSFDPIIMQDGISKPININNSFYYVPEFKINLISNNITSDISDTSKTFIRIRKKYDRQKMKQNNKYMIK